MKYDEKDVPIFKEEVCLKTCIECGRCINEGKDNHWFLMCPHYHEWKIGYENFACGILRWQREHPEIVEQEKEKNARISKKLREEKKKTTSKKKKDD